MGGLILRDKQTSCELPISGSGNQALGSPAHAGVPVLLAAGCASHQQSRVVTTETMQHAEPELFTTWLFAGNHCRPLS